MIRPFLEQKNVNLCRSGIQFYTRNELLAYGFSDSELPDKPIFREFRPAPVIVKAKDLFKSLPLVKEHPDYWVDANNWNALAGGYTGSDVEVVEEEGEICLRSSLVITTKSLYDYYNAGNKEVSVGYQAERKLVYDNPDYDLIMTEITDVNHLALTAAGRGGHTVAILDSLKNIIGGLKMARTGLFYSLFHKGKTEDSALPFSAKVFAAMEEANGKTGDEYENIVKPVFDSLNDVIDGEDKNRLVDMVKDSFERVEAAKEKKEEVSGILDSLYEKLVADTMADACKDSKEEAVEDSCKDSEEAVEDSKEEAVEDSDGKGENTNNIADSEEAVKEEAVKDSAEDINKMIKDSIAEMLPGMIEEAVKKTLGVTDTHAKVEGQKVTDSVARPSINIEEFMC